MLTYTANDLWQPCELDISDGICLPYVENSAIKIYINGAVTDLAIVDCNGDATPIPLESTNYVIAEDDKGELYTYITDIPIGEEITCFSFSVTTESGTQYTPCYTVPTCYNKRKYIYISSEFSKYDCLGRWYGEPQNVIEGNPQLLFTNGFYVWGELYENATTFEFTNFKQCTVTKTNATKGYQLQALSIPPYVVKPVEAILGRGIIEVNGTQYAVQNGTHFERIIGACRSQWDMNVNLSDCGCEINHDCDLDLGVDLLPCSGSITYECETDELSNYIFPQANGYAMLHNQPGAMQMVFPGNTTVASDIYNLINNAIAQNAYAIQILSSSIGWVSFYVPYISNLAIPAMPNNDQVTFNYIFTPPATYDGCNLEWATIDNLPPFEGWQIATGGASPHFYALDASLVFTATVTGSTVLNAVWSANVPFTPNGLLSITVPIPTAETTIEVSVDITPERCGELSLSTIIDDDPILLGRFVAADASVVWDTDTREMVFTETSYTANDSVATAAWQIINISQGYTGGGATSGTGNTFSITNIGDEDDFIIRLTVTTASGLVSISHMLFGQNRLVPDEDFLLKAFVLGATFTGTEVDITCTYGLPINTYEYAVTADEVGLDADNNNVYEQTCNAVAIPCTFSHDYLTAGTYAGKVSVSIFDSTPPPPGVGTYDGFGFGFVRCEYGLSLT